MPHAHIFASAPRRLRPVLLGALVVFMTLAAAARAQAPPRTEWGAGRAGRCPTARQRTAR